MGNGRSSSSKNSGGYGSKQQQQQQQLSLGAEGRLVHTNGLVEGFRVPMPASSVLASYPQHIVCLAENVLCFERHRLSPDDVLQTGKIYFLLPLSVTFAGYSVTELAVMAARLMNAARKKAPARIISPLERCDNAEARQALADHVALRRSCKTWRPLLNTIPESSSSKMAFV